MYTLWLHATLCTEDIVEKTWSWFLNCPLYGTLGKEQTNINKCSWNLYCGWSITAKLSLPIESYDNFNVVLLKEWANVALLTTLDELFQPSLNNYQGSCSWLCPLLFGGCPQEHLQLATGGWLTPFLSVTGWKIPIKRITIVLNGVSRAELITVKGVSSWALR